MRRVLSCEIEATILWSGKNLVVKIQPGLLQYISKPYSETAMGVCTSTWPKNMAIGVGDCCLFLSMDFRFHKVTTFSPQAYI